MKKFLGVFLSSLCSLNAFAAEKPFSIELLGGQASQKSTINGFGSTEGDDFSFGVRGALQIHKNFALEAAYHDHGETDDKFLDEFGDQINDMVSSTAINVGVKGIYPFGNGFSIHGRVGLAFWDAEIKETDSSMPGEMFKASDDGNDIYYGLGLQYDITPNYVIGAEYTMTDMDVSILGVPVDHEVKNISLSIGYRF